jgi:hypothetical protein
LLFTVEAVVAVIGAYTLSKELWSDFDDALVQATKHSKLRWSEDEYFYVREDFGTLQRFWQLARTQRSGYQHTLPKKIDFVAHSNSKTVDMAFTRSDLTHLSDNKVKIASIIFQGEVKINLKEEVMIIVKLTTHQKGIFGTKSIEYYQVLQANGLGTLDAENAWHTAQVFVKRTNICGKLLVTYTPHLQKFSLIAVK